MKIEIDESVLKKYNFNFEKVIKSIIKNIPQEHILGLGRIWVTDSGFRKEQAHAYGYYYGKREGAETPAIIINITNLFNGLPKFIFYCLPLIPKLFLAKTLYHEVAHHYQRLRHGITKERWENDAEIYSKKMMVKMFGRSIDVIKIIFGPITYFYKKFFTKKLLKSP